MSAVDLNTTNWDFKTLRYKLYKVISDLWQGLWYGERGRETLAWHTPTPNHFANVFTSHTGMVLILFMMWFAGLKTILRSGGFWAMTYWGARKGRCFKQSRLLSLMWTNCWNQRRVRDYGKCRQQSLTDRPTSPHDIFAGEFVDFKPVVTLLCHVLCSSDWLLVSPFVCRDSFVSISSHCPLKWNVFQTSPD